MPRPANDPESTIATNDPGDLTANRYRFQWTWAAVACCTLLDSTEDVEEVFCEHHEDVLLKHKDGTFTGQQVKTRNDDQPSWRAGDEAVVDACVRFIKLDRQFPGKFRQFIFLTNHPLHSSNNGQDLSFNLRQIRTTPTLPLPTGTARWLSRVARCAGATESAASGALSKVFAVADLPKLRDALVRLVDTLAQCWKPAADCSHGTLTQCALGLIEECSRASSLDHEQTLPGYFSVLRGSPAAVSARIEGKRMTLSRVLRALERQQDSAALLTADPNLCVQPGAGSTDLLHKKLDAGGFSVVSRNAAEDLRDKADYLGIAWTKKYGRDAGLQRYSHVRSIVLSDAGRAFEATRKSADGFGPEMREDLLNRLKARRAAGEQLFDATDDHLEGMAFSLTSQCMIVWSHAKPWESE